MVPIYVDDFDDYIFVCVNLQGRDLGGRKKCQSFPGGAMVKSLPANVGDAGDVGFQALEDSWRKAWQPTPLYLPGESHGQRRLAGHSPWGQEELNMTD